MSVFLRWGIFGILAVAALVYAYNASKRMAEKHHAAQPVAAVSEEVSAQPETAAESAPEPTPAPAPAAASAPASTTAPHCQAELVVAQRALDARREGVPLDRLLRIQEIAWQEPAVRRRRLEEVAKRWYEMEGEEPVPEALSIRVISDCVHFSPAP